jgi:capsular polysaccharide export protein
MKRAENIANLWQQERVSKYNDNPTFQGKLPDDYVLVIDQVAGDLSISAGCATPPDFTLMLQAALDENPSSMVVLKSHPDLHSHAKSGHFSIDALSTNPRIQIITDACHPVRLIAQAKAVYTVTSQMGFEALIWGIPVRCFGMPFYAGYGLTVDAQPAPAHRKPASLQQIIHGALVKYPRYFDPETRMLCDVETVIRHIGRQRLAMSDISGVVYAIGFSAWKRSILRQFLPGAVVQVVKQANNVPEGATIVVWGNRRPDPTINPTRVLRIEDGFLRSSGLGADLIQPVSWAIDDVGIYYDPRSPSRLEHILQAQDSDHTTLGRAEALITLICASGISKYNIGGQNWSRPSSATRVILVPGQVEKDASILAGACDIKTNMGLLRAVRAANPDAYVVYKPHPDVAAGLRRAGTEDTTAHNFCNEVVHDIDPVALLSDVDEVHTLTSLLGFEALLRSVKVTCYGQPFYAGWGLTHDIFPIKRRTAQLTLTELVSGALIRYPRYVSRASGKLTTPERAIAELAEWRRKGPSQMSLPRRILRSILRIWVQSGLKGSA